jgi:hypothetical protein
MTMTAYFVAVRLRQPTHLITCRRQRALRQPSWRPAQLGPARTGGRCWLPCRPRPAAAFVG